MISWVGALSRPGRIEIGGPGLSSRTSNNQFLRCRATCVGTAAIGRSGWLPVRWLYGRQLSVTYEPYLLPQAVRPTAFVSRNDRGCLTCPLIGVELRGWSARVHGRPGLCHPVV